MSWTTALLGEVCQVGPRDPALSESAPFVPMAMVDVGSRYPSGYEQRGSRGGVRARADDILFARITPCLENGKLAQLPRDAPPTGGSTEFIVIRPGPEVDPGFIYYWCMSPAVRKRAEVTMSGTTGRMRLAGSDLAEFALKYPSIDEQRRIVDLLEDHLSQLDAANDELSRAAAKLVLLRERTMMDGLIGAAFPDRSDTSLLPSAGTADGILPVLPRGWSWSRLGDVADVVGGVTKDAKKQSDPTYVELPYLRVANVQRGHLALDDVASIRVPPAKAEALRLEPGDVLLNEGGDRDKLARGWVWEGQIDHCIHQNHVFRARIREPRLDPCFLSMTANTMGGLWAERNGKQSVNLASISLGVIRKMPVIVPAEGEAERIVTSIRDRQSGFDRIEAALGDARARSSTLRKALLTAAFSGRLTRDRQYLDTEELVSP